MTRSATVGLSRFGPVAARLLPLFMILLLGSRAGVAQDAPGPDAADRFACDALKAIDLSEGTGARVRLVDVGILPASGDQPELCRVNGVIEPQVGFEVRMPVKDWNSKLLVTGCFKLCGILEIEGMEDALARGYAAATTADMGDRATHVTTLTAKEIVASYYGDRPDYSYFRGCSTGGLQALVAAERYPDDFDGIIAGAPFNQSLSVPHMAWALAANSGADGKPILTRTEFELLGKAALEACDAQDGQADGVIGNPETCGFKPEALQCPATGDADKRAPGHACLTPAQVEAATKIYSGPRTSKGQAWSSGGSPVGSEFTWEKSLLALAGKDLPAVNFDVGPAQFAATNAVVGFKPDLERFRALGGRLLVYHGWADEGLMPAHTLDYWRDAGQRQGGDQRLNEFARLFMVPGMLHCGGGPGAADIDYLTALERWVEVDEAPASLLAHKVRNAVPTFVRQPRFPLAPGTVEYTRPVYPYPRTGP